VKEFDKIVLADNIPIDYSVFAEPLSLSSYMARLGGFESLTMHSYTITKVQILSRRQRCSVNIEALTWLSSGLFFGM
jgi:hypothetical protein